MLFVKLEQMKCVAHTLVRMVRLFCKGLSAKEILRISDAR